MPKISELPAASSVSSGDTVAIVQGGVTKRATISDLPSGTASNPFGSVLRPLSSFTGATDSAKYRDAVDNFPTSGVRYIVVVPSGTVLDSGANNPFVLPSGFHTMIIPGPTDEFEYQGALNFRHTGSTTTLGTFKMAAGSKAQKFTGICFVGTSSSRAFVDTATDGSDGAFWQYVHFRDCSFDQCESVWTNTGTGIIWDGFAFVNNMAAGRSPFSLNGSDHHIWTNGGFFEMGAVASYATRAACPAMVRMGNLNCVMGAMYTTGSPTTPYRIDGGNTGVDFYSVTLEGRPSPGTTVDGSGNVTGGLHCAGPLMRMTGGRATVKARHFAYAMRDPDPAKLGYQPGGFFHVVNAQLSVLGGTFNPYSAGTYPAWTRPDGVAVSAGTQPPLAWIEGSSARASFVGILRGPNCTSAPIVYARSGATVTTDGTVTVVTV